MMARIQGLKRFPGSKRVQQDSDAVVGGVACVLEGKHHGMSTRSNKRKASGDIIASHGGGKRRKTGNQTQVQMIASILTRQHSIGDSGVPSNSPKLKQSRVRRSVKQTARRLADKVVRRTIQIVSKPSQACKLPSAVGSNLQVNNGLPNRHKKGFRSGLGVSHKNANDQPRNKIARLLRSQTPKVPGEVKTMEGQTGKRKRRKYKKSLKEPCQDNVLRIKNRVRYLLNRIKLEQNLIDAYSAEGWKGQSREKIRPEKELQRAESQILKCKLGIREAVHQLDSLGLEGSIEDSVFDSEGQIYHEDIFCAKCKCQEAFSENDIILCDGACNRAFHQLCLEPPLKTEDIPPGDEGWLCPVCDCKLECSDIVNTYFGTNYQVEDSWEDFFSEAAAAASGKGKPREEWPSEDSEDDDYNPDDDFQKSGQKPVEKSSASAGGSSGLSGSDSGSDSSDDDSKVSFFDEFAESKRCRRKKWSGDDLEDEVDVTLSENEDSASLVGGKRQRKEVDYKKLHDEMFGKGGSESELSEDEEWGPIKLPKKGKQLDGSSQKGATEVKSRLDESNQKDASEVESHREKKNRVRNGEKVEAVFGTSNASEGKRSIARLPPYAVEKLREVFSQNQLPSRACKEELAKQIGISLKQVKLWFKNVRYAALRKGMVQKTARAKRKLLECHAPAVTNVGLSAVAHDDSEDFLLDIQRLEWAQLKIENLKRTLEGMQESNEGSNGLVMYVPVAELKEKVPEVATIR